MKALLVQQDPSLKDVIEKHPGWDPVQAVPFHFPQMNADGDPPNEWQLIAAGWGFAKLDPASAQADNGAGVTRGIIGLVNKGQPRKPDDWGALRAWGWAAGRGLDYLETDPAVDAKHVGIEGVSRYGKAALVTMAFDQRFAMVLVGSSGKGGATLLRRNYGEAVESLTGGEYYWMAGKLSQVWRVGGDLRQQESWGYSGRFERADCAVRAAADLYQLWDSGKGRRALARSPGQLDGNGGGEPRVDAAGSSGLEHHGFGLPHSEDARRERRPARREAGVAAG